jgi:NADPH-dependent glutamate synthase beta subunit-like oxidoreductase
MRRIRRFTARDTPASANHKRVAVVGGGLSGVSAAIRLAIRGYAVTVFETRPRLLERIRSLDGHALPASAIDADLAVLLKLGVTVHCDALISRHAGPFGMEAIVTDYEAVYLATGPELFDESSLGLERTVHGRFRIDPLTLATSQPKVFAGGAQRYGPAAYSPVYSVADGNYAPVSIDRFLQGASLAANRDNQGPYASRLFVNTSNIAPAPGVPLSHDALGYTIEEARQEAGRCFPCHCLECVKVCPYPKSYVRQIYNNESIVMGMRKANRMINSCALCGLCAAVCPENLNMADVCLDARQGMVLARKMPPSTHDFALRDMAFSQSDASAMARHQPGFATSHAAFLPGCQLSASAPGHVASCYEHLQETLPGGVGLILGCC